MSNNLMDYAKIANLITGLTNGVSVKKVSIDNQIVEYLEAGRGEPMVFIHGFGGLNFQWRYWLDQFKNRYRVIAVTIPDLAPTLDYNKSHYSFRKYGEWLDQFLIKLNAHQPNIVSHCTGSCIAAFYASMHPGKVKSLVMIAPPDIGLPCNKNRNTTFDNPDLLGDASATALKHLTQNTYYSPPFIPAMVLKVISNRMEKNKDKIVFLMQELSRSSKLLVRRLSLIDTPTLIIGGENDRLLSSPDSLQIMRESIPRCELIMLRECGHFPFQEQRDDCIAKVKVFVMSATLHHDSDNTCKTMQGF